MAFVLSPVENHSTKREVILNAWVYEGVVEAGRFLRHVALLDITSFGIDPTTEESVIDRRLIEEFPVGMEILRIFKAGEQTSLPAGYHGAFLFEDWIDSRRIAALLDSPGYRRTRPVRRTSREFPHLFKEICLFDKKSTANEYLKKEGLK